MRAGIGYDIHRLAKGRKLVLGGVEISHPRGLLGHSDGDVLHHALVDAALGAAGLGDIGDYFPSGDFKNKDRDSLFFVKKTKALLSKKGFRVAQMDCVIIAEEPRLSSWKNKIKQSLSKSWAISAGNIGLKAKTNEGLDAVGQRKAIACHAVVVLESMKKGKK